jgi:gliding motility-associated-like protein
VHFLNTDAQIVENLKNGVILKAIFVMKLFAQILTILLVSATCRAAVTAGSNSPVCVGSPINLTASSATGATYTWYGPAGFFSVVQNPVIASAALINAGTYTVVQTVGAVKDTATVNVLVTNVHPPVPVIPVIPPVCTGQNIDLFVNDTPGVTYSWVGPNGFSSTLQNPVIVGVTNAAQGTYTVSVNYNGCSASGPATVFVFVYTTPIGTISASNGGDICQTATDSLNLGLACTSSVAGCMFTWSGPAGFSSGLQNPTVIAPTPANSGIYSVLIRKIYGSFSCFDSLYMNVSIMNKPSAPLVGSNAPLCAGTNLIFSATGDPLGHFFWSGPSGYSSNLHNPIIIGVPVTNTGTYKVFYYDSSWCPSDTGSIYVKVDTTAGIPTISTNAPICAGDTLKFTTTESVAGVNYQWVGPHGFSSTLQNPVIAPVAAVNSGSYQLTVEPGPCQALGLISVSVNDSPTLTVTNNSPLCAGDTLRFNAVTSVGATISWIGPYNFSSNINTPTRAPAIVEYSGIYTINTVSLGGCTNTVYDTVVINATPANPYSPWLQYCQDFDAPPLQAIGSNIMWYPSSVPGTPGSAIAPTPATNIIGATFYYLNQTVAGCTSKMDSTLITIRPKPLISTTPGVAVCPGDTTRIGVSDTGKANIYYHWEPYMYISDTSVSNPLIKPIASVAYTVVGTNDFGCKDTAGIDIIVHPAAVVYIPTSADNFGDSIILFPGDTVRFNIQTNCVNFNWFPPQTLSDPASSNPIANPLNNTKYIVTASTIDGCVTQDSVSVYIRDATVINVPNAFTPGHGVNNKFKLSTRGIAFLRYFRVYDRWGVLLFETTDINEGWDGSYKGAPQPLGVYVYSIDAVTTTGGGVSKDQFLNGNVTLLR